MFELLLGACIIVVPGAIPLYLVFTFVAGFMDSATIDETPANCTKRYQIYSGYKLGVRFNRWMRQEIK